MSGSSSVIVVPSVDVLLEEHRSENDLVGLAILLGVKVLNVKITLTVGVISGKSCERKVDVVVLSIKLDLERVFPQG